MQYQLSDLYRPPPGSALLQLLRAPVDRVLRHRLGGLGLVADGVKPTLHRVVHQPVALVKRVLLPAGLGVLVPREYDDRYLGKKRSLTKISPTLRLWKSPMSRTVVPSAGPACSTALYTAWSEQRMVPNSAALSGSNLLQPGWPASGTAYN